MTIASTGIRLVAEITIQSRMSASGDANCHAATRLAMPRRRVSDIERRLPVGQSLPLAFTDFLAADPPASIEWNGLKHYSLKRSASREAVPFLRLSDGGLIAFWFHEKSVPIVHIGGHGELQVIACDFDHFLKAINTKSTGLGDLDEAEPSLRIPSVKGRPRRKELAALQREFDSWFERHSALQKPQKTTESEKLRKQVVAVAESMLRDGKSKVYDLDSEWWSMDYRITLQAENIKITYLDFGKWYSVPKKYKLIPLVTDLLAFVKRKNKKQYELSVASYGGVSIDKDTELLIVPPNSDA